MRRNLTISFDEGWIETMDAARGEVSRGKWLEQLKAPTGMEQVGHPAFIEEALASARTSPKLRSGIKPQPKGGKK